MCVCLDVCVCVDVCEGSARMHVQVWVRVYACLCMCVYVPACVSGNVYACV